MTATKLCILAAALPLAAAACGSEGGAAPDSPSSTVSAYFRAVERADGRTACSGLTSEAQRHIAELQGSSCADAVSAEARRLPGALSGYEIVGQDLDGERAIVRLIGQGMEDEVVLRRVGADWRIESAPGLGLPAPGS